MTPSYHLVIEEMTAALIRSQAVVRPYLDYAATLEWLETQSWVGRVWPDQTAHDVINELYRLVWWRAIATGRGERYARPHGVGVFQDDHLWPKDKQEIEFSQQLLDSLRRLQAAAGQVDQLLDRFEEALYGQRWRWDIQHPRTLDSYPPLDLRDFAVVRHEVLCRAGHELWLELTGWEIWQEDRHQGVGFLKSRRQAGDGAPLDPAALHALLERAARLPVDLDRLAHHWPSVLAARRACRPLPDDLPVWVMRLLREGADDMFGLHWPGVADEPATRLEQLSAAYLASWGTGGGPSWLVGWRLLAKHHVAAKT